MSIPKEDQTTGIGYLPTDWRVERLGDYVLKTDYGTSSPSRHTGTIPVLRMGNVQGGYIDWRDLQYTNDPSDIGRYELQSGDLVFNRTNTIDLVGKTAIYRGERAAIFAGYLVRLRTKEELLDPYFLNYFMNSRPASEHSRRVLTVAVGQANINAQKLRAYPIPLPPLPEQRAIAAALSDVDALLDGLDRVIAKKRAIKQATMQQLLTGRTRLPGFSGEWEVKRLGEVGLFTKGLGVRKDEARSGDIACVRYGEIYTHHDDVIRRFNSFISRDVALGATRLQSGDILFAGSGETKSDIGKFVAFLGDCEAFAGSDIVILRQSSNDARFLGYYLNSSEVAAQKASYAQGDAVVHIGAGSLGKIVLKLPPLAEQTAIANVLSDMDVELEALELRRHKTQQLKQGMMQELLTGRTRLV